MKVLQLGECLLREKSLPVTEITDEIRELARNMFFTLQQESGVGLAAPQIGRLLRMFVVCADDGVNRAFINPQIIATSNEMVYYEEGCLSIPKLYQQILRPARVTVQAFNEHGKPFTLEADGLLARVIQHEYDHLDGILFIDRGDPAFKKKVEQIFEKKQKRREEKTAARKAKAEKLGRKLAGKEAAG